MEFNAMAFDAWGRRSQSAMFSFGAREQGIPTFHPLRKQRVLVDGIPASLRGAVCTALFKAWAPVDSAGMIVAGKPDPDAAGDSFRAAIDPAYQLQPAVSLVRGSG